MTCLPNIFGTFCFLFDQTLKQGAVVEARQPRRLGAVTIAVADVQTDANILDSFIISVIIAVRCSPVCLPMDLFMVQNAFRMFLTYRIFFNVFPFEKIDQSKNLLRLIFPSRVVVMVVAVTVITARVRQTHTHTHIAMSEALGAAGKHKTSEPQSKLFQDKTALQLVDQSRIAD